MELERIIRIAGQVVGKKFVVFSNTTQDETFPLFKTKQIELWEVIGKNSTLVMKTQLCEKVYSNAEKVFNNKAEEQFLKTFFEYYGNSCKQLSDTDK